MKRTIMNHGRTLILALSAIVTAVVGSGCSHRESSIASRGAIQQVALVWLKQAGDPKARQKIIAAVHDFGRLIPEVKSASVGVSDGQSVGYTDASYDVCFVLTFADEAARQRYNQHPVHVQAANEVFLPLSKKLLFYRFTSE